MPEKMVSDSSRELAAIANYKAKRTMRAIVVCYAASACFALMLFCLRERSQPWFIEHQNPHWIELTEDTAVIASLAGFAKFFICGTALIPLYLKSKAASESMD